MSRYLLDTTLISAFIKGRPPIVRLLTPWLNGQEATTSILVYGEVIEYLKSFDDFIDQRARLIALTDAIRMLYVDRAIMERYADIRRTLRSMKGVGLIGDVDTLIAATALEHNLTLVTADSDFDRVPELKVLRIDRPSRRAR